ncbi:MAG: UDP-3-O-(3-hydroxymyristoyl)glucosamine N-acyltransferase [Candidatus Melainabacteria bacterium]
MTETTPNPASTTATATPAPAQPQPGQTAPAQATPKLPRPPVTLAQLAQILPEARLVGNGEIVVQDLVHPKQITSPLDLVLIIDPEALAVLQLGVVQAAIIAEEIAEQAPIPLAPQGALAGYIAVKRPRHALATLLNVFDKPVHKPEGVHPMAVVEFTAEVHPTASVGAFAYVGEYAKVGENTVIMPQVTVGAQASVGRQCLLHPGVRIGERVVVGNRVIIHHNASLGADGFSFVTPQQGSVEAAKAGKSGSVSEAAKNTEIIRINSIGTVVVEDDVEIGACATIDRATLGATRIKRGTKLDNLVQVGHNNTIGENCLIAGQAGISGSCSVGDRVVMAGQAGIADHLKIGHDAIVMAKSGVMRHVEPGTVVGGTPALPAKEAFRSLAGIQKIPEMRQELRQLKERLAEMEAQLFAHQQPKASDKPAEKTSDKKPGEKAPQ